MRLQPLGDRQRIDRRFGWAYGRYCRRVSRNQADSSAIASRTIQRSRGRTMPYRRPGPGRRQPDQRLDVRVAADDAVEGDHIGGGDVVGATNGVALHEGHAVGQAGSIGRLPGHRHGRRGGVRERRSARAGAEQLLVDDADAASDVEDGSPSTPCGADEVEEHARRPIRTLAPIATQVAVRVPAIEDRGELVTAAGVHRRVSIPAVARRGSPSRRRGGRVAQRTRVDQRSADANQSPPSGVTSRRRMAVAARARCETAFFSACVIWPTVRPPGGSKSGSKMGS